MCRGPHCLLCLLGVSTALRFKPEAPLNRTQNYYWAGGHGSIGRYGTSSHVGPRDLQASFAWSWQHPGGKLHNVPYGIAMDSAKNIYLTTETSVWKISSAGKALWSFTPHGETSIRTAGALSDGRMHFTTTDGRIFAISMDSGRVLWQRMVCESTNLDNSFVSADQGIVLAATNEDKHDLTNRVVRALNATTGQIAWTYRPQAGVRNFLASFPNDDTVLYQDVEGRAYRHELHSGKLVWKNGGTNGTWNEGVSLYADGLFYTMTGKPRGASLSDTPHGFITAHLLADGAQYWKTQMLLPPQGAPAMAKLHSRQANSLVVPGGHRGIAGGATALFIFDPATGKLMWTWDVPSQQGLFQAAPMATMLERKVARTPASRWAQPWSPVVIDAAGTIYVGHKDGVFYALRDEDGDHKFKGSELSAFATRAPFATCSSPAVAEGMVAVASLDGLYVFGGTKGVPTA